MSGGNVELPFYEALYALVLFMWVLFLVTFLTKKIYHHYITRGLKERVIIYYNRKIIHILAGGLIALLTPFLFTEVFIPFTLAMVLAVVSYIPYKTGRLNYWYQVPDNMFDVHFCLMWGLTILLSKLLFNNWWVGIVPILFMSFGDAVTGIVRNAMFKRRTKSWWGNLAMLTVCTPIGSIFGFKGILPAIGVSIIEHYEYKWINDNITVPLISFLMISML
ncbi:dolichol kinase [Candidatus Bathyarchaeota archaeon]|nr:MAG: dolichol kinase [Candidatus Bathyarchaeota archaeon]